MSGGAGHVMDMIRKAAQNRASLRSNKSSYKKTTGQGVSDNQPLKFKEVSKSELAKIKKEIVEKSIASKKKQLTVLGSIVLLLIIAAVLLYSF